MKLSSAATVGARGRDVTIHWFTVAFLVTVGPWLLASPISIPNSSFELPPTPFVDIHMDSWQKVAKPSWYDESGPFLWNQLTGTFHNTAPGSVDHIGNCDGDQALWLFAVPEVGFFQDYDTMDWDDPAPTHAFNEIYSADTSYALTVGIIGGGGGMLEGTTLDLVLYYRDASSNRVLVATTTVTNSLSRFPNTTNLVDCSLQVPPLPADHPALSQHIGILIVSTVSSNLAGGYWDLDHVRLTKTVPPRWRDSALSNGQFTATLQSEAGMRFDILSADDPNTPIENWSLVTTITNLTGTVGYSDAAAAPQRFYRARQIQ